MKEKIKQALIKEYKSLGYSAQAINVVLEYLEKSIKEETEIDEAVVGVGPMLKQFQSEINRLTAAEVTAELAKKKTEDEKAAADKKEKEKSGGVESENAEKSTKKDSDEVPEWAKGLIESNKAQAEANKALADKLAAFENGKTSESRKQAYETALKDFNPILKDVYIENFDPLKFKTDDEFNQHVEATKTKIAEKEQSLSDQGLSQSTKPFQSAGGGNTGKQASKEELDAVMANL